MIAAETDRHAGSDTARELIDGGRAQRVQYQQPPDVDAAWWRAHVTGLRSR